MDTAHSDLLTRWQQLHFEERQATEGSHKADSLRNLLTQVQHAANVDSLLSPEAVNQLMYEYSDCYGTVVDSPLEQQGLDNYADGALALAEGKKNESEQWQCSLDIDELMKVDFIQDFCNANKKAIQGSLPPGGETTRISIDTSHLPSDLTHPTKPTSLPAKPSERQSLFRSRPDGPVLTSTVPLQPRSNQPPEPSSHQPARGDFWTLNKRAQAGASDRETYSGSVEPAFSRPAPTATSNRRSDKRPRENEEENDSSAANAAFRTARQQLAIEQQKKYNRGQGSVSSSNVAYGTNKKSLGARRGINSKFVPPVLSRDDGDDEDDVLMKKVTSAVLGGSSGSKPNKAAGSDEVVDERLKNIEPKMIELITNEIMDSGQPVAWDDIAGLEFAKKTIKEIVVWPMLRPDIFTGLRGPPKGLLLFGPPGTGKTLIGKCIASQSKSTFFSISASSLTSKWVGEGEKMVRALFAVARVHQPAVIFIDEIDSLLSQRSDGENEASRRIKTEFLVQLDGATTGVEDRILVVGATNRPQEIDEAARRRFVKRLYIPLPENEARRQIVVHLLSQQNNNMTQDQLDSIAERTDGYSGSDMANLCREAALGPIRSMAFGDIENITADQVRPINFDDCLDALKQVRASVSEKDLELYLDWNKQYGSWGVGK